MEKLSWVDFINLTKRDIKVFYKDKASFITSLITPFILVILYVTFLKNVYDSSLLSALSKFGVTTLPKTLINGFSAGWLMSSIMATTCVTLTFCGNTIVVADKLSGASHDIEAAPVKRNVIYLAYFASNFLSTFFVAIIALGLGFIYMAFVGWYLSIVDVLMIFLLTILLTLFGSFLASIIMSFLHSQGGITTWSIIISSLYGFLCGAYMPISSFSSGLANLIYCLPGTYGTMALRHYFSRGSLEAIEKEISSRIGEEKASQAISSIKNGFDVQITAFGTKVEIGTAWLILSGSILIMLLVYLAIVYLEGKRWKGLVKSETLKR
jgi:multidrug/hemolysin transport system permease protein